MVGPGGLEPLTSSVSRKRSNQLSYGPEFPSVYHDSRPSEAGLLSHSRKLEAQGNPAEGMEEPSIYRALKRNAGSVRYLTLPREAHGYSARKSIEDVLSETLNWFGRFVKNAGPREMKAAADSKVQDEWTSATALHPSLALWLAQAEFAMRGDQRLLHSLFFDHKRNVAFRRPLRNSDQVYTVAAQRAERFARDTGNASHVFSHHRNNRNVGVYGDVFHVVLR